MLLCLRLPKCERENGARHRPLFNIMQTHSVESDSGRPGQIWRRSVIAASNHATSIACLHELRCLLERLDDIERNHVAAQERSSEIEPSLSLDPVTRAEACPRDILKPPACPVGAPPDTSPGGYHNRSDGNTNTSLISYSAEQSSIPSSVLSLHHRKNTS